MNDRSIPLYVNLLQSGELQRRAGQALEHLSACDLCPWDCGVDRAADGIGFCRAGRYARVASYGPHMGEEDPLRGSHGSGTVFIASCNLRCQYCQNHDISQGGIGEVTGPEKLAAIMLSLQAAGCHNINIVSPSHVVAQLIEALAVAAGRGLRLPIVYNTGGYDSMAALTLLDGIVDIYMPDMKYSDNAVAQQYSKIPDYVTHNRAAVTEMHRQVGDLTMDEKGIAQRGLLVRHLVLPGDLAGTADVARFLAEEISHDTYINIMGQYRPEYKARTEDMGVLSRPVSAEEIAGARAAAEQAGLHRFDERKRPFWMLF